MHAKAMAESKLMAIKSSAIKNDVFVPQKRTVSNSEKCSTEEPETPPPPPTLEPTTSETILDNEIALAEAELEKELKEERRQNALSLEQKQKEDKLKNESVHNNQNAESKICQVESTISHNNVHKVTTINEESIAAERLALERAWAVQLRAKNDTIAKVEQQRNEDIERVENKWKTMYTLRESEWKKSCEKSNMKLKVAEQKVKTQNERAEKALSELSIVKNSQNARSVSVSKMVLLRVNLRLEQRLRHWLARMSQGTIMMKYDFARRQRQRRWVSIGTAGEDEDVCWEFQWCNLKKRKKNKSKVSTIPISSISDIVFGATTENFKRQAPLRDKPWCCFSILAHNRSYDFAVAGSREAMGWVEGLQELWKTSLHEEKFTDGNPVRKGRLLWKLMRMRLRCRRQSIMLCPERAASCLTVKDQVRMAILDAESLQAIEDAKEADAAMMDGLLYGSEE